MAHMDTGAAPGGPYPDKAGEYCGNHHPDKNPRQTQIRAESYYTRMRFGRPHACKEGSEEEMEDRGWVGLYLKEDRPLMDWEVPCECPESLTEPK